MSAARDVSPCQRLDRWVTAYVDCELDAIHALEVEDHLDACEPCREQVALLKATRCSLKRMMASRCPNALRKRICRVLVDAHASPSAQTDTDTDAAQPLSAAASEEAPSSQASSSQAELTAALVTNLSGAPASNDATLRADSPLFKLRHIMPLAAAATVLLVFGVMRLQEQETQTQMRRFEENAVASLDHLLEEMVAQHAHPPPPETTDPNGLSKFDPYLGLHVPKPDLDSKQVRFVGARMMPRRHAMLQYMLRDRHRVSLYVFDSKRVPLRGAANRLKPKHIGARNVYVGKLRGYSVAASERDGVGYVVTSDLAAEESANLVLTASR